METARFLQFARPVAGDYESSHPPKKQLLKLLVTIWKEGKPKECGGGSFGRGAKGIGVEAIQERIREAVPWIRGSKGE